MDKALQDKIYSIRPVYSGGDLPTEVTIFYEDDDYYIDLSTNIDYDFQLDIWVGEHKLQLSDEDTKSLQDHLEYILEDERDLVMHYENAELGQNDGYFIR